MVQARIGAVVAALCLAASAQAGDLPVPGTFASIQAAIDAAGPGDRVLIAPGTYAEALILSSKTVTLENGGPDGQVVLIQSPGPAASDPQVVSIGAGNVTLRGLTIDGMSERRGILANSRSVLSIEECTIRNGVNAGGFPAGGLDMVDATALITDSRFEFNSATTGAGPTGGHIALELESHLEFAGTNVLADGLAARGGALWVGPTASADVWQVTFQANTAFGAGDNDGGAICAEDGAQLTVISSFFDGNIAGADADSYGGAIYSAGPLLLVSETNFTQNAAHAGGAIGVDDGAVLSVENTFHQGSGDKGGGIACVNALGCISTGSHYSSNDVDEYGAAIYMWDSVGRVDGDTFCSNAVTPLGSPQGYDGGAIRQVQGSLSVTNTVFMGNAAADSGGAIAMSDGMLDSANNHYLENTASYGAGGAIRAIDTFGFASQADSTNDLFVANQAASDGAVSFTAGLLNSVNYAWLWNNQPNVGTIGVLPTNYVNIGDPELSGWTTGSCDLATMEPGPGSPLVDAGSLIRQDADGSRSDIGAFGGAGRSDGNVIDDADGDGVPGVLDCNDDDPNTGLPTRWHPDVDRDGWGDMWTSVVGCDAPDPAWIDVGGDCDDTDPSRNPTTAWYRDADLDGLGDAADRVESCEPPTSYVDNSDDCDDTDPGIGGPRTWYLDGDGDGYGTAETAQACDKPLGTTELTGDCDDEQYGIHPGANEVCDGVDQDCDGVKDEDPVDAYTGYVDADGDGFGAPLGLVSRCDPSGLVDQGTDCDDTDPTVYPGAEDAWYDGVDSDCNGADDYDADRDGFAKGEDCNDTDAAVYPGADETPDDGVDSDCDDLDGRTWLAGGGCACDGSGSTPGAWVLLAALGLVGSRRRP